MVRIKNKTLAYNNQVHHSEFLICTMNEQAISELSRQWELVAVPDIELFKQLLAEKINRMIETDFSRLISLLYRLDVAEEKLRSLLKIHAGTNAGLLIAELVIEREEEKIRSRKQSPDEKSSDEERW